MKVDALSPEFVDHVPDDKVDGVLYISIPFATAIHRCCCGCGNVVVTPLSPVDWRLTYDGETVSLYPSIGNWGFPCQSHYWISQNRVEWAKRWPKREIEAGRALERVERDRYYTEKLTAPQGEALSQAHNKTGFLARLDRWWRRR
jgi:hypothetical protein